MTPAKLTVFGVQSERTLEGSTPPRLSEVIDGTTLEMALLGYLC